MVPPEFAEYFKRGRVKPPPFEYHAPVTLEDACVLLATLENAKVLAGGQSLIPMLNMRFAFRGHLVGINGIPDLDDDRRQDQDIVTIGKRSSGSVRSRSIRQPGPRCADL